ncbi:MAG: GIY-YIG nuclease family protein [Oscillospiraceae bacterium]|nr:GIY-YIG nuclease family protein [Oscillospiraceae bacterium]
MSYYIYMLSNPTHTVLYVGVTRDLLRRVDEHRRHVYPKSFTAKYGASELVYFEVYEDIREAIGREKQIKSWNRKRKNELVNTRNPRWLDLFPHILEDEFGAGEIFPKYWNGE